MRSEAPTWSRSWTRLSTSRVERPSRSRRTTTSSSPSRRNCITVASSGRSSADLPDIFSERITVQPAAFSFSSWMVRSWSVEETRA